MSPTNGHSKELHFTERMWGYVSEGAASFEQGYLEGKESGNRLEYRVTISIEDLDALMAEPEATVGDAPARHVPMAGWASCGKLFGETLPLQKGAMFGLYWRDPQTGERRMSYDFQVTGQNKTVYTFSGYKRIVHDPGTFDMLQDHTTLYATLQWTEGGQKKTARGIIYFHVLTDLLPMLLSMFLPEGGNPLDFIAGLIDTRWKERFVTAGRFFLFVSREASEEYLEGLIPRRYETDYNNWVCKGTCKAEGVAREFFLFSGIHAKGFPWGGDETFSDIGLILRDASGSIRRFALSDRSLQKLELEFKFQPQGVYRYEGSLFEIVDGYQVSFTDMRKQALPEYLREIPGRLELTFTPQFVDTRSVPFEISTQKLKEFLEGLGDKQEKPAALQGFDWMSPFLKVVEKWLKELKPLGYAADIYKLCNIAGSIVLDGTTYEVVTDETLAEGEYGKLAAFTLPALYYHYFCAVEAARSASTDDTFRVQVRSGTLRSVARGSVTHWVEELLGKVIGNFVHMDLQVVSNPDGTLQQSTIEPREKADALILPTAELLEINNNHYPGHRIFQRRIVALPGTQQKEALAMEEAMSILDLTPLGTDRSTRVAVIKNADRFSALDHVMQATGFFDVLERAFAKSRDEKQKTRETFSIVIKPSFSFMYSLTDISSYTDPALVKYLIDRIRDKGFRNITVVEAQSTYATFFTNRDVKTLARYVGYLGENYAIADLSEDYVAYVSPAASAAAGKPTQRDVHPVWRDADFRISFAKNKTHAYAFYTLTIKNIYGALPRQNKFKEYHCNRAEFGDRPIYTPAIELLQDFPVHFGFIDAYFSADGVFGVFADPKPEFTGTIIGGEDLVAIDWIGASKMGLDPKLSAYMQLAITAFGKPEITLIGDHSLYENWQNVPLFLPQATTLLMDRNYSWGLIIYAAFSMMDPFFAFNLEGKGLELIRLYSLPLRAALLEAVTIGERGWEAVASLIKPPSLKELQQLLELLAGDIRGT
jgi:uncharacterized protein (DUF362 family)